MSNENSVTTPESWATNFSRISSTLTDENVTQIHIIQMLQVLFNQSSKEILKVNKNLILIRYFIKI